MGSSQQLWWPYPQGQHEAKKKNAEASAQKIAFIWKFHSLGKYLCTHNCNKCNAGSRICVDGPLIVMISARIRIHWMVTWILFTFTTAVYSFKSYFFCSENISTVLSCFMSLTEQEKCAMRFQFPLNYTSGSFLFLLQYKILSDCLWTSAVYKNLTLRGVFL